jgi:hypothetical protein
VAEAQHDRAATKEDYRRGTEYAEFFVSHSPCVSSALKFLVDSTTYDLAPENVAYDARPFNDSTTEAAEERE